MRIIAQSFLLVGFLFIVMLAVAWLELQSEQVFFGQATVVDGDSVVIDGERVRLVGIDAPELRQTCSGENGEWKCGWRSRQALLRLIDGRTVRCESSGIDRYGRWLGQCRAGSTDINRQMILDGWAVSYGHFEREETMARNARRNLWAGRFDRPSDWRKRHGDMTGAGSGWAAMLANVRYAVRYLWSKWFGG